MKFASPEMLWLLVLVPIAAALMVWRSRRRAGLRFSSALALDELGVSLRQRVLWLPGLLRLIVLALVIVALARPQEGRGEVRVTTEGVAIMAVIDRSYSMRQELDFNNERARRIDVVREVFLDFVLGNEEEQITQLARERGLDADSASVRRRLLNDVRERPEYLPGRPYDLVGLVTFSGVAETLAPLSRTRSTLEELVCSIRLNNPNRERAEAGTAIGEGVALAAARLDRAEEELELDEGEDFILVGKAIVLLTDGDENVGEIRYTRAAEICKELGITVHAIGIGGGVERGRGFVLPNAMAFDTQPLEHLAEQTGGIFRMARDGEALEAIYAEIDELEKSRIESEEFTFYDERFAAWLWTALVVLACEVVLRSLILRRSP